MPIDSIISLVDFMILPPLDDVLFTIFSYSFSLKEGASLAEIDSFYSLSFLLYFFSSTSPVGSLFSLKSLMKLIWVLVCFDTFLLQSRH